jgi:hypothetical protein
MAERGAIAESVASAVRDDVEREPLRGTHPRRMRQIDRGSI